jgi:hypothetical protein
MISGVFHNDELRYQTSKLQYFSFIKMKHFSNNMHITSKCYKNSDFIPVVTQAIKLFLII